MDIMCERIILSVGEWSCKRIVLLAKRPDTVLPANQNNCWSSRHMAELMILLEITSSPNTSLVSISFIPPKADNKFQPSPNTFSL